MFRYNSAGFYFRLCFWLVVCCAFCLAWQGAAFASGPLAALSSMQRGIDNCDSDAVTNAVDIPAVVNKASDSLLATLEQQSAAGNLGDSKIAMMLAFAGMVKEGGQQELLRQLLISEVRGFVVSGVNGGYFAGKPNGSIQPSRTSLAGSLDKIPKGRRQIIPGGILEQSAGTARVYATFIDPGAGKLPLELLMQEQGGAWRVVEVTNAAALCKAFLP